MVRVAVVDADMLISADPDSVSSSLILSGISVICPADGDLSDETYYSAGRRSGSPPYRPALAVSPS